MPSFPEPAAPPAALCMRSPCLLSIYPRRPSRRRAAASPAARAARTCGPLLRFVGGGLGAFCRPLPCWLLRRARRAPAAAAPPSSSEACVYMYDMPRESFCLFNRISYLLPGIPPAACVYTNAQIPGPLPSLGTRPAINRPRTPRRAPGFTGGSRTGGAPAAARPAGLKPPPGGAAPRRMIGGCVTNHRTVCY